MPTTEAGRVMLEREALNSRSFALITAEAIEAIEEEAAISASYVPLVEIQRLRDIEAAAYELLALGNQPGLDDEEWEAAFTSLEKAARGEGR